MTDSKNQSNKSRIFIVDRKVEIDNVDYLICENLRTEEKVKIMVTEEYKHYKPLDVLVYHSDEDEYILNSEMTQERKEKIGRLFDRLKKKSKKGISD